MTFDEGFIKIASMQQELQKMEQELIVKTVNEQGGIIADERVKEHYNFEDEDTSNILSLIMKDPDKYDYQFRAYDFISHKFLWQFCWMQITAKEFNNRLKAIYGGPFFESRIMLNWI